MAAASLVAPALPARSAVPFTTVRHVSATRSNTTRRAVSACAGPEKQCTKREVLLRGVNLAALAPLASLFTFGAVDRPSGLGVQDYGNGAKQLALCPKTKNCISTAEELNDDTKYVPPWTYNPEEGRGRNNPISQKEAMQELIDTVSNIKPDKFEPKLIAQTEDYVAYEFQSPTFGFIDDVEFLFTNKGRGEVEYRSASRLGESDGDINRKRIRAIRKELQKKGW
eukprot:CAMPEP_0206137922 /NCGR_PEP_ID=MMETSP1473-20131121/2937_1 /ASSEMBLY_ACC=CAM_ASM_001109 /TAXON_ID=1461547 /ORGANISM="Stichococcus sp, Strain RCC1054" /LENGTH=224 /DNA_ID=CAMNT_0053531193 /DNA_START=108 /DNA_END=779 /DNA_ORIENTATION=-